MSEGMFGNYSPESDSSLTYETDPKISQLLSLIFSLNGQLRGVKLREDGKGWRSISDGEKSRIVSQIQDNNRRIDMICIEKGYKRNPAYDKEITTPGDLGIREDLA